MAPPSSARPGAPPSHAGARSGSASSVAIAQKAPVPARRAHRRPECNNFCNRWQWSAPHLFFGIAYCTGRCGIIEAIERAFAVNTVAEWLAAVIQSADSLGVWMLWVALLLVLGAAPPLLPRRMAGGGSRGVIVLWAGLVLAAVALARGDAVLRELERAGEAVQRDAGAHAGRLEPLFARLPAGAGPWLAQLPWREIGLASALLILLAAFYIPRRSRFGHGR
jgi:hypothetical protein